MPRNPGPDDSRGIAHKLKPGPSVRTPLQNSATTRPGVDISLAQHQRNSSELTSNPSLMFPLAPIEFDSQHLTTVKNKKYSNAELNYSIDILKWKMFRIYKLFPAYSLPEKWSEYSKISITFLAQNRLHFPGCLFFLTVSQHMHNVMLATMMWCNVTPATQASYRVHCRRHVCITSCASCCVRHAYHIIHITSCAPCVSHRQGRWSGKISASESLAPQKNKCPRNCNLFWARKVVEIFKYSDHFSGTECAGNSLYILNISILGYLWNSLNIPGIFPQYSAFIFLLFTVNMMQEWCDCAEKAKWQSMWVWNTKRERTMRHRGATGKGIWDRGKGSSARILRIEWDE